MAYALVLIVGFVAGTISGIIGTGSSILLLPILVFQFGPKQAVPIMAIAGLMANIAKVLSWWREIDWRACAAFSVTGVPAAALGARTLLRLPPTAINVALGLFFLGMIPLRRWLRVRDLRITLPHLALAGAVIGFLTGIVLSTGPLSVPAFASYGLLRGALLSTEAASALLVMLSKVATFQQLGALPVPLIAEGLIVGSSLMAGSLLGKTVVQRMSTRTFEHLLDGMLLCSGLSLLWAAWRVAE
ncbi:MAG: sulfite exporter TauE/SafE family protein [Pseudomonadota bacterium]